MKYINKFLLSVLMLASSVVWYLLMFFYLIRISHGHTNNAVIGLFNQGDQLLKSAAFCYLAFYLLWATIKGSIDLGISIPFVISVHKMKFIVYIRANETLLNTFLFNVNLMIISAFGVCSTLIRIFPDYLIDKDINSFMEVTDTGG